MKYENFETAKSLVEQINKHKKVLEDISNDNISVRIMDGQYTIMTIGSWPTCEHSASSIAADFIKVIKSHYNGKLIRLYAELQQC